MVPMHVLAKVLRSIHNAQKRGRQQVLSMQCSRVVILFLTVVMVHGYTFHPYRGDGIIDDHRAGDIVVTLTGSLNECGVSAPDGMC